MTKFERDLDVSDTSDADALRQHEYAWVEPVPDDGLRCPAEYPVQVGIQREFTANTFLWTFTCNGGGDYMAVNCSDDAVRWSADGIANITTTASDSFLQVRNASLDVNGRPALDVQTCNVSCTYGYALMDLACKCPPGSFINHTHPARACQLCPQHTVTGDFDQTACSACNLDFQYTPGPGSSFCTMCANGFYLDREEYVQRPCEPGHRCYFCDSHPCEDNTYQDEPQQLECKVCGLQVTYNRSACAVDTQPPVITLPAGMDRFVIIPKDTSPVPTINATAFDAFDGPRDVMQSRSKDGRTVTLSASDKEGRTSSVNLTVIYIFETVPLIRVFAETNTPLHVERGQAPFEPPRAEVFNSIPGDVDLNGNLTITQKPLVDFHEPGVYEVVYNVTAPNALGNYAEPVTLTVIVSDTQPPVRLSRVPATNEATRPLEINTYPLVFDASPFTVHVLSNLTALTPSVLPANISVQLLLSDAFGNNATIAYTYTVEDTTPPVFTSVASEVFLCSNPSGSQVGSYASRHSVAMDAWDGQVPISHEPPVVHDAESDTYTVTLTTTDSSGNSISTSTPLAVGTAFAAGDVAIDWATGTADPAPATPDTALSLVEVDLNAFIPVHGDCLYFRPPVSTALPVEPTTLPPSLPPWFPDTLVGTFASNQLLEATWETCGPSSGVGRLSIVDTTVPTITLDGDSIITFEVEPGVQLADPGIRAHDAWYGDVSTTVCAVIRPALVYEEPARVRPRGPYASHAEAVANVDNLQLVSSAGDTDLFETLAPSGSYAFIVYYTLTLPHKQVVSTTRFVLPIDTRPPILRVENGGTVTWPFGFRAPLFAGDHVAATDVADGDVSLQVNASALAAVDSRRPGFYIVPLTVADRAGNVDNATVRVVVRSEAVVPADNNTLAIVVAADASQAASLTPAVVQEWLSLAPLSSSSNNIAPSHGAGVVDTANSDVVAAGLASSLLDVWVVHNVTQVDLRAEVVFPELGLSPMSGDGPGDGDDTGATSPTSPTTPTTTTTGSLNAGRDPNVTPTPLSSSATTTTASDAQTAPGDADDAGASSVTTATATTTTAVHAGRTISTPTGTPSTTTSTSALAGGNGTSASDGGDSVYLLVTVATHDRRTAAVVDALASLRARAISGRYARTDAPFFVVAAHVKPQILAALAGPPSTSTAPTTSSATTPTPTTTPTHLSSSSSSSSTAGMTTTAASGTTSVSGEMNGSAAAIPIVPVAAGAGGGLLLIIAIIVIVMVRRRGSGGGRSGRGAWDKFGEHDRTISLFANPLYKPDGSSSAVPTAPGTSTAVTTTAATPTAVGPTPPARMAWGDPTTHTLQTAEERAFHDKRWNEGNYDINPPRHEYMQPVVGGRGGGAVYAEYASPDQGTAGDQGAIYSTAATARNPAFTGHNSSSDPDSSNSGGDDSWKQALFTSDYVEAPSMQSPPPQAPPHDAGATGAGMFAGVVANPSHGVYVNTTYENADLAQPARTTAGATDIAARANNAGPQPAPRPRPRPRPRQQQQQQQERQQPGGTYAMPNLFPPPMDEDVHA
ncbi:hypothetical protein PTSG_08815 [Salpingoeca rosetta]|uniref:Uncharacterized protein n=1 Tax=Salpingoeca rosetta (strain ATCC 50818 / BSB-021) TaxID=946362 RepID=F2UKS5_SALR5|nr:uncharacterized protein PTSG_08815 [Salpingoeca rosetta]EGD77724.1 hypothetical protein PTSG_08815 [Salpingoeca rosetta]|eukprot:XP_004990200.1 hypothetical protein PTSG_08815 [Salpingoeca rosetta]